MKDSSYRYAALVSLVIAILGIPLCILAIATGLLKKQVPELDIYLRGLEALVSGLGIYVYLEVKRFLNKYADFHSLNSIIGIQIALSILFLVVPLAGTMGMLSPQARLFLTLPFAFLNGVLLIISGKILLGCRNDLFGYKRKLSYSSMAIGFALVSIVLSPIGILICIVNSIYVYKMLNFAAYEAW